MQMTMSSGLSVYNWLWLCLQLAHATEKKEDEDKGDELFALS